MAKKTKKAKAKRKTGPKPETLTIEGNWEEAIKRTLPRRGARGEATSPPSPAYADRAPMMGPCFGGEEPFHFNHFKKRSQLFAAAEPAVKSDRKTDEIERQAHKLAKQVERDFTDALMRTAWYETLPWWRKVLWRVFGL